MRPLHLTMTAFGSYGRETSVDFEQITGGLYLIVGKTGAGKTTIFDAISFALFGKPSGSERTVDMLHSDFVEKSVDTVVQLVFLHQGKRYTVERTIHFRKKRGSENEYSDGSIEATMLQEDMEPLMGATRVTARCEELLGLNAEQFRRIVMLAQGEFREFLRSDSNKKNEILGRLFDNRDYVRFQNLLSSVRDSLQKRRASQDAQLKTVMNTLFRMPEGENGEQYLYGHPRLTENLSALIDREDALRGELDKQHRACADAVEELTRREAAAETDNTLLNELGKKMEHREELALRHDAIELMRGQYTAAERAIHRVKPRVDDLSRASSSLEQAKAAVTQLEKTLLLQLDEKKRLAEIVTADAPRAEHLQELHNEERQLKDLLPRYGELSVKEKGITDTVMELSALSEGLSAAAEQKDACTDRLQTVRADLDALADADAETVRCQAGMQQAQRRWDTLAKPGVGIAGRMETLLRAEEDLSADESKLDALTQAAAEAEAAHHALYQALLAGQSGLMADQMRQELERSGQTVCPVCRTVFRRGAPARFAELPAQTPSQDDVDRAEKTMKRADDARRALRADMDSRRTLLDQRRQDVVRDTRELDEDCTSWDVLVRPDYLPALKASLAQELENARRLHQKALEDQKTKTVLSEEKVGLETDLNKLESLIQNQSEQKKDLEIRLNGLRSAAEEIRKQLPFPDTAQAEAHLSCLHTEAESLKAELDAHADALRTANEQSANTEGALHSQQDAVPGLNDALSDARSALSRALEDNQFGDLDAYQASILPVGDHDAESWLNMRRSELVEYDNDVRNTAQRVVQLREMTAGKTMVNLEQLGLELQDRRGALDTAAKLCAAQANLLTNHRDVLARVKAIKSELAETGKAYERINRLAELAVGVNSEGGKLSFDRYVMGTIFREVLEMANRRLDVMTGGQFELVHSIDAGRRNASAGLEIEILDVAKGKCRPSGSISGGEGFMVSLALALGLSDVVQNHAGGQKLDTLFIDEGFGSLDDGKLGNVITVLQQLTEGNRLVGIISHVDKLEESIPHKFRVRSSDKGSTLTMELS